MLTIYFWPIEPFHENWENYDDDAVAGWGILTPYNELFVLPEMEIAQLCFYIRFRC